MTRRWTVGLVALAFIFGMGSTSASGDQRSFFDAASPDLSRVLLVTQTPLAAEDDDCGCWDAYIRTRDELTLISSVRGRRATTGDITEIENSTDLNAVAFETHAALSDQDKSDGSAVYLWRGGEPRLLAPGTREAVKLTAISEDGTSVFVRTKASLIGADPDAKRDLYRWRRGDFTLLSAETHAPDHLLADFDSAGKIVFLQTGKALSTDDRDAGCEEQDCRLDTYRVAGGETTLVTTGPTDPGMRASRFEGASADGMQVTFRSGDALTPDDTNGLDDVYLWSNGVTQRLTPDPVAVHRVPDYFVETSPEEGPKAVIGTKSSLVEADTDRESDLYVVSPGEATLVASSAPAESIEFEHASPSFNRINFLSRNPLKPSDNNHRFDIYSWNRVEDRLRLVTPGIRGGQLGSFNVYSRSGGKVLFETHQQIDAQDQDGLSLDAYVATGGGFQLLTNNHISEAVDIAPTAAAPDLRSVVAETPMRLNPGDGDSEYDLYLLSRRGEPQLLSSVP